MSPRTRGIVPIAIVVCASISALVFKGTTEWLVDVFVSACGGLACRLKSAEPKPEKPPRRAARDKPVARKPSRNARHRAARSGIRKPRAHRPARVRLGIETAKTPPETAEADPFEVGLGV